jgi:hypothetical protein
MDLTRVTQQISNRALVFVSLSLNLAVVLTRGMHTPKLALAFAERDLRTGIRKKGKIRRETSAPARVHYGR